MQGSRGAEERFVQVLSPLPLRTSAQELATTQSYLGRLLASLRLTGDRTRGFGGLQKINYPILESKRLFLSQLSARTALSQDNYLHRPTYLYDLHDR
ncbi:MAG: hypothetical protein V7L01_18155 [Nostoc sp.]|uniref:hypothetical protein n=1 Tax=Nostoc sp. TaxID=1180 RepID=UPI002FF77CB6